MAGFPRKWSIDTTATQVLFKAVSGEMVWKEIDGRRKLSDEQAVNDAGIPKWKIDAMVFDRDGFVGDVIVSVPAKTEPNVEIGQPVAFEGLTIEVWSGQGGFAGRAYANGLASTAAKPKASASS